MEKNDNKPDETLYSSFRKIIERIKNRIAIISLWIDDRLSDVSDPVIDSGALMTDPPMPGFTSLGLGIASPKEVESFKVLSGQSGERTVSITRRNHPERALMKPETGTRKTSVGDVPSLRQFAGKRVSMENPAIMAGGIDAYSQFSRTDYWQQTTLSSRFNTDNFSKVNIAELAELLTELSPEVSAALWYYLLCCNSGYELKVVKPGTDEPDEKAKVYLDACMKKLGAYHGTLNTFFDKTFMSIFMRGSFLYELILMPNGRDFADIAAPDTKTVHFMRKIDDIRGQIWDFGQYQGGSFVSLNIPTIRYVPLHPLPGRIEGRAMVSPVFFTAIFLMSVLRDLKRVIQQQGYMRLDLEIIFEKLERSIPNDAKNDPEVFKAWADGARDEISQIYSQLEPDDAFVHSDAVKVNNPVGTANMTALGAMDSLFGILERMAVRALKTLPALLGLPDSGSNQGAENRKFEFYQKGNETIQRMVETAFGDECKMILQAGGFQADVKLQFAQMRASEELRDLQIENLKAMVARYQFDAGWISQDEASKKATGKETSDQQMPRVLVQQTAGSSASTDPNAVQPDPGINRFFKQLDMIRTPTMGELTSAMDIWKENAPENVKNLIEAGVYEVAE